MQQPEKTWNTDLYEGKNAFVWKYGQGVIELLAPKAGERILDLGCGTAHLTNLIRETGAEAIGLDRSTSMITEARRRYPDLPLVIADGTCFAFRCPFDAVFSNAAIHWMRDQTAVARCIWEALVPGGRFVAEFGGKGNIQAIREAISAAVQDAGETVNAEPFARFYPTIGEYAAILEAQGFRVTFASHFDRPTKLEGPDGMKNWILTFADNIIESIPSEKREKIFRNVEQRLKTTLFRDGSWFADYRRIRIAAFK
jgi:trans-aconitate methyltransferase